MNGVGEGEHEQTLNQRSLGIGSHGERSLGKSRHEHDCTAEDDPVTIVVVAMNNKHFIITLYGNDSYNVLLILLIICCLYVNLGGPWVTCSP